MAFGLTENLSGRLNSAAKKLNVVTLNEKPENIKNLEKQIGAKYLISGSLQKVLDTIRISIKLIDTETLSAVWSENFDKKYTAENIFALQDEIVSNVVDALVGNGAILAQEVAKNIGKSGTNNLNAYECVNFVRGQYFKVLSPQMHAEGLSCLRRSVLEDPEYKEAWQLLAHMLSWGYALYVPFLQPVSLDGLDEAEKAIDQAIRIDKDFARAYATRAELAFHKRDWSRLVEYAKKAYELGPLDAANVGHLSYLLTSSGSGCNAKPEVKVKFKIDDDSCYRLEWGGELAAEGNQLDAVSSLSFDNYGLGTYNRGIKNWQGMLEAFEAVPTPDFHLWNLWIGIAHHNLGNIDKAKEYFDTCRKLYSENLFEKLRIVESVWHFEVLYEDEEVYNYMKDVYNWN